MSISPAGQKRFWARVEKVSGGCWEFSAATRSRSGHRVFYVDNRRLLAHRAAWEMLRGPIPEGLCVCHHCDNPPCVNPDHLFVGTVADNNADRDRKGRGVIPRYDRARRTPAGPVKHGTLTAYVKRKCRCNECRQAKRTYDSGARCGFCGMSITRSNLARHRRLAHGLHLVGDPDALPLPKAHLAVLAGVQYVPAEDLL